MSNSEAIEVRHRVSLFILNILFLLSNEKLRRYREEQYRATTKDKHLYRHNTNTNRIAWSHEKNGSFQAKADLNSDPSSSLP